MKTLPAVVVVLLAIAAPASAAGYHLAMRDAEALGRIVVHKTGGYRDGPCKRASSSTATCKIVWTHEFARCVYQATVGRTASGGFFYRSGRPVCHVVPG